MSEYEPDDSRNVTGTASTPDGRWTNAAAKPPAGVPQKHPASAGEAAEPAGETTDEAAPAGK